MYAPEFFADPHPTYARMREEAPVHRVRNPNGLEYWLVTRFDEARAVFADPRLAKDPRHAWDALRAAGIVSGDPADATFDLHTTDGPDHTRLRGLVTRAFTAGRVDGLRARTEEIAAGLLDAIADRGTADLVEDFAYPLSLTVIAELLGVPAIDLDRFRAWTLAAMTPPFAEGGGAAREEGRRNLRRYVTGLVAAKRADPGGDDLLSALIAAPERTDAEVVALTQQLLFAGHEPATNFLGNALVSLFRHPEQLARLRADPGLLPAAVEELLRFDGPTARSSPSYTLADVEVGGTVIPAGSVVIVGIAAANRDPRRFTEPDRLDVTRGDDRHLAFGHGVHRCVGAALARMEAQVALGALLRRFPHLAPARPVEELAWLPFPVFRGVVSLPVTTRQGMKIPRAVAVVTEGSRVLVIKRFLRRESSAVCVMCEDAGWPGPGCPGHRYAVLPGGHVEDGESAEEAAVRELAEETGLRATVGRQLWVGKHNGRPAFYFRMADVTGVPVLSGTEATENGPDNSFELMWVTAAEFEALNLHPADVRVVLARVLAG